MRVVVSVTAALLPPRGSDAYDRDESYTLETDVAVDIDDDSCHKYVDYDGEGGYADVEYDDDAVSDAVAEEIWNYIPDEYAGWEVSEVSFSY